MRTPKRLVNAQTGEVYYRVRYRKDGQQRALSFYGDTALTDAEEFTGLLASLGADKAVAYWNAHLDDDSTTRGMTLDDWWPRYLESLTGITDGTRDAYDGHYRRVWSPALGKMPLTAIRREDIAKTINQLSRDGKADKTVKNVYGVLTSCLKVALLDGHIPAVPTRGIRLPRATSHTRTEMRFLDRHEWDSLHAALPAQYRPLFTFLIGTGARWGEAEALTVGDLMQRPYRLRDNTSVHRWVIAITKAAKWNATSKRREVGPTKTDASNRVVVLHAETAAALLPLTAGRAKGDRLFTGPRGGPINHRIVYDVWKKACADAGLVPRPRIHDLRHTHVSWLIAENVPLTVIQRRLGHEQITTTSDRYGHLMPEVDVAAAEASYLAMRTPMALGQTSSP